ncbi:MAG: beta-aspartyl-peptidase [Alphaproteobacteria bacterium]|nr:MAG: beta-aspartyl-peptidase [Alphaproteobacteria bacterium]
MKAFLRAVIVWGMGIMMTLVLAQAHDDDKKPYVLVIHGGAGTILKKNMTAEKELAYRTKLDEALRTGQAILEGGGTAVDAVVATINVMENSPLFNAGKGAVFNHRGENEMDASIMDGRDLNAGAVAGVRRVKNPINLAREVMTNSKHVMLSGEGAEEFADSRGVELVDPAYFRTKKRWNQLQKALERDQVFLDHDGDQDSGKPDTDKIADRGRDPEDPDQKFGTVGAAALDIHGNLAAGTSTGGMTNKRWNRIGDSPVIGAGTYADNNSCALSATGHGEYFLRAVVAHSVCALMEYKGLTLQQAADEIVMNKLVRMGGEGGIIAVDRAGNVTMTFNTEGMYRGYVKGQGEPVIQIYKEE